MPNDQRKGLTYSAALHALILFFAIVGLPSFLQPEIPPQPMVVAVDILPISEVTNVKPSELPLAKEEKPEPKKEEKPPTPPVTKDEPPPPPPPPEPKPEPKKEEKPVPKKEEKKPDPKKDVPKKAKEEDLDKVLKSLRDEAKKEKSDEAKEKKKDDSGTKVKAKDTQYDPGLPMSMTELDAIRSQIAKCWSVPAGAKNAHELRVTLRVQLAEDGTVIQVDLADESITRYASDSFFRAAADSARRAVQQCSPLKNLPPEKFQTWRDIIMTFDPKEMLF